MRSDLPALFSGRHNPAALPWLGARRALAALAAALELMWLCVSGACLDVNLQDVDLSPPAVEQIIPPLAPDEPPQVVPVDATLRVRLSEPLDPWSVNEETVLVVTGAADEEPLCTAPAPKGAGHQAEAETSAASSAPSLDTAVGAVQCPEGWCAAGRCLRPRVDRSFLRDANTPPLSAARQSRLHPVQVHLGADGQEIVIVPKTPYEAPMAYSLVLSAGVRDRSGNPLGDADGHAPGYSVVFHVLPAATAPPESSALALLAPEPGSEQVPANLAWLTVGVRQMPAGGDLARVIELQGPAGPVPGQLGAPEAQCPADLLGCYRLELLSPLSPSSHYVLALAPGTTDAAGIPLSVSSDQGFTTGAAPDTTPPVLADLALEAEGGCFEITLSTSEPAEVLASLLTPVPGQQDLYGPTPMGEHHHLLVPIALAGASLSLTATDPAGNTAPALQADLPAEAPPPIALTEVLANPSGPEPQQEWVEIVNLGDTSVDLSGWRLTDDLERDGDTLPSTTLPPGSVGLVVGSAYDPEQGEDPEPAPEAVLLRLEGSTLGSGGLSNSGEPVWLLDPSGRVVTHYPGLPADGAVPANGQSVVRDPGATCAERSHWRLQASGGSSPGWLD